MEIRCIHSVKTGPNGNLLAKAQLFLASSEISKAVQWAVEMNVDEFNIYVGVNPKKPGTDTTHAASDKDVEIAFFNFADIDSNDSLQKLSGFNGTQYSFAVTTGTIPNHRPHIYWELQTPARNLKAWRDTQIGIANFFNSDRVINPSRIMRLAGTINYPSQKKTEERNYVVELSTIRTEYDDPREAVEPHILHSDFSNPDKQPQQSNTGLNLATYAEPIDIPKKIIEISSGTEWHNKSRDVVASFVSRGFSDDDVMAMVPIFRLDSYSLEQTSAEISHFLTSAREKFGIPCPGPILQDNHIDGAIRDLPLIYYNDIRPVTETNDFVEGILCDGGLSVLYGESNCGKTFFATDISFHIATGKKWRCSDVDQGGVIYAALEGGFGIKNRIAALKKKFDADDIPFAIIPTSINLLDNNADINGLLKAVETAASTFSPIPIKLIVIDTLARAMGGGNENSPDDMGALVISADKIRSKTSSHLMFIHHSGKDQARGARGHSSLRAASDTEIEISRDKNSGVSVAKVSKQRDMETQGEFGFVLETVELGLNKRNKRITSCVVVPTEAPEKKTQKLSDQQYQSLKQLRNLLAEKGTRINGNTQIPNVPVVSIEEWKTNLGMAGVTSRDNPDTARKQWSRIKEALVNKGVIGIWGDRVWLTGT